MKNFQNKNTVEQGYINELINEEVVKHLKKSEDDIKNGRTVPAEIVFKELEEKYGF